MGLLWRSTLAPSTHLRPDGHSSVSPSLSNVVPAALPLRNLRKSAFSKHSWQHTGPHKKQLLPAAVLVSSSSQRSAAGNPREDGNITMMTSQSQPPSSSSRSPGAVYSTFIWPKEIPATQQVELWGALMHGLLSFTVVT